MTTPTYTQAMTAHQTVTDYLNSLAGGNPPVPVPGPVIPPITPPPGRAVKVQPIVAIAPANSTPPRNNVKCLPTDDIVIPFMVPAGKKVVVSLVQSMGSVMMRTMCLSITPDAFVPPPASVFFSTSGPGLQGKIWETVPSGVFGHLTIPADVMMYLNVKNNDPVNEGDFYYTMQYVL